MATHTTYYNLTKPSANDKVNIGVLNDNADIIDTTLHNKVNSDDLTANNVMLSDGVTSVEYALDEVADKMGNMRMTKLWENPSPTSAFDAQTVVLPSDDWNFLLIISRASGTDARTINAIINADGGYLNFAAAGQGAISRMRTVNVTDKTHIAFDNALYAIGTTASTTANASLIPVTIYGIKLA